MLEHFSNQKAIAGEVPLVLTLLFVKPKSIFILDVSFIFGLTNESSFGVVQVYFLVIVVNFEKHEFFFVFVVVVISTAVKSILKNDADVVFGSLTVYGHLHDVCLVCDGLFESF